MMWMSLLEPMSEQEIKLWQLYKGVVALDRCGKKCLGVGSLVDCCSETQSSQ